MNFKNMKNPFKTFDKTAERIGNAERGASPQEEEAIEFQLFETEFDEKGKMRYFLFKSKHGRETRTRILRLFRVRSVSNDIRININNEQAFKNILNNFRAPDTSFVALYAYKPGENLILGYGVLMEGLDKDLERLARKSEESINVLETQFRSAYSNIEIAELTHAEAWVGDSFYYDHLTLARGIPKSDPSLGKKAGATPYGTSPQAGREISEILLKGMTSKRSGEYAAGYPFLMYAVFDPIERAEIQRAIEAIQNWLGKLGSSSESSLNENENFSLPLMFGFGFGEMFGQSHQTSTGTSDGHTASTGQSDSQARGTSNSDQSGTSDGTTKGTTAQEGATQTTSKGTGGAAGASMLISDNWSWNQGASDAKTASTGHSDAVSLQNSHAKTTGASETSTSGTSKTQSDAHAASSGQSAGDSASKGSNQSGAGGVNIGDGSGIGRHIKDYFHVFATDIFLLNEQRYRSSLRDGMFDFRMVVMTESEEGKLAAEELIKQAYTDNEAPIPIRVQKFSDKEERTLKKYAKAMAKPKSLETRYAIPDRYRHSTYITPTEASAFNLPQENLPGYDSSFDPIPSTISYIGKMDEGANLGNQWNRYLNMESQHPFMISKEKLAHIGIFGGTGTGKTVFTQRFVSEVHNKFDINFILFDWTKNHRSMINHIKDTKKFRYNSFDPKLFPLKVNLLQTPPGSSDYKWNSVLSELLCYSMGLGDRSFRIITKVLKRTKQKAREQNYEPTMEHMVKEISAEYNRRQADYGGRMPFNEQETFASMRERLEEWLDEDHPAYHCMCKGPFLTIDDMVKGDFVHLIECANLPAEIKQFMINGISAAIFHYCAAREEKLKKPTYLMFEEAHSVLQTPTGKEPLNINETIFETMNREARNYNLFIGYICQSPEKLPELIFDNLPIRVIFQIPDANGKAKIISAGGKDPVRLDVDLVKWISMQPRGTCMIRISNYERLQEGQFVSIKVGMLATDEIPDSFFKTLYTKKGGTTPATLK